jgi:hypothetical protein
MTRYRFEGDERDKEKWRMPHIMLDRIARKRHDQGKADDTAIQEATR